MRSRLSISRLAAFLLLAGLLLVGRTTIATHAYEHDLAEIAHDCEFCESVHVSGKDLVPDTGGADYPAIPGAHSKPFSQLLTQSIRFFDYFVIYGIVFLILVVLDHVCLFLQGTPSRVREARSMAAQAGQ